MITDKDKNKQDKHGLIDSIRFSIRITPKSVSSVSLKKNITSLWLLLSTDIDKRIHCISRDRCKNSVTDFIYKNLNTWEKDSAKGFSDFITEKMINEILEKEDFTQYQKIKSAL